MFIPTFSVNRNDDQSTIDESMNQFLFFFLFLLYLQVGDGVVTILLALEARETHLGLWNILLWVLKIFEQGLVTPGDVCK
jgi:hypothetical protein